MSAFTYKKQTKKNKFFIWQKYPHYFFNIVQQYRWGQQTWSDNFHISCQQRYTPPEKWVVDVVQSVAETSDCLVIFFQAQMSHISVLSGKWHLTGAMACQSLWTTRDGAHIGCKQTSHCRSVRFQNSTSFIGLAGGNMVSTWDATPTAKGCSKWQNHVFLKNCRGNVSDKKCYRSYKSKVN